MKIQLILLTLLVQTYSMLFWMNPMLRPHFIRSATIFNDTKKNLTLSVHFKNSSQNYDILPA
jgi:hypothetical protein